MIKPDIKKLVLLNLPYLFAFYFVDKVAVVFRMAPGTEMIDKLSGGFSNFGSAFATLNIHDVIKWNFLPICQDHHSFVFVNAF